MNQLWETNKDAVANTYSRDIKLLLPRVDSGSNSDNFVVYFPAPIPLCYLLLISTASFSSSLKQSDTVNLTLLIFCVMGKFT